MALDPSVPLGVQPMGGQPMMNPIQMIGQWAQLQQVLNQNKLFEQTFNARQKAGQILASAPDLEAGLQGLLADPDVAPFAPETINSIRQSQLTMQQIQSAQQTNARSGLDGFIKALGPVFADPTNETWNNTVSANMATLSPETQRRVAPAIDSLRKTLLGGLDKVPPEKRQQVFMQRLSGMMISSGFTPEGIKALAGTPGQVDLGDRVQPTLQLPPQLGGGTQPAGPAFPKGLAPQVTEQGGVPITVGGPSGGNPMYMLPPPQAPLNQLSPVPGSPDEMTVPPTGDEGMAIDGPPTNDPGIYVNPLEPTRNPLRDRQTELINQQANPLAPAEPPVAAAPAPRGVPSAPLAGPRSPVTGKPLFDGIEPYRGRRSDLTGAPLLPPGQQEGEKKLQEVFQSEDRERFESAIAANASLDRIDHDIEALGAAGGALQPGAFGAQRLQIAKTINMMAATAGFKPDELPFDPELIAQGEDVTKEQIRAGLQLITQNLGAQREAASVIFGLMQAVPGIDNTLLGDRLISRSLRAMNQYEIDRREFQEEWNTRRGALGGSVAAFNRTHPAKDYFTAVLKSMGMDEHGFESPIAIQQAMANGYLSKDEAAKFLVEQFPDLFQFKK